MGGDNKLIIALMPVLLVFDVTFVVDYSYSPHQIDCCGIALHVVVGAFADVKMVVVAIFVCDAELKMMTTKVGHLIDHF